MSSQASGLKDGQLVLPGERLGVIEEFIPDAGTYVEEGVIYSRVVGRAILDMQTRRVSVNPVVKGVKIPKIGSTVLSQVMSTQNENASARIFKIGDEALSGVFSGVLHISDVQMRYVDSMFDVCKPGDILRASVISEKNRVFHLSTKEKELGVVYAFCSQCGFELELKRHIMRCPRCGNIEKRKTALDYGKGEL
jgi:exosome complex component CSL4